MSVIQVHVIFSLLQKYPMFGNSMKNYELLPEELNLLTDKRHYQVRSGLALKVMTMLGDCADAGRAFFAEHSGILPPEVSAPAPKISRGEN